MLDAVLEDLAGEAKQRGLFDGSEAYVDASFARAKGGGAGVGITKAGKDVKIMAIVDRCGLPLSLSTHPANPHESTLVRPPSAGRTAGCGRLAQGWSLPST